LASGDGGVIGVGTVAGDGNWPGDGIAPGVGAGIEEAEADGICIGIIVAAGLGCPVVCWSAATAVPAPNAIAAANERTVNIFVI
jgi:hypothetical protein